MPEVCAPVTTGDIPLHMGGAGIVGFDFGSSRKNLDSFLKNFESCFCCLDEMHRLKEIWQAFGVRSTSLAHNPELGNVLHYFDHKRYEHSIGVGRRAAYLAMNLGWNAYAVRVAAAVGYFHDIAVPSFCHIGERVLKAYGFEDFDHDLYSAFIVSQAHFKKDIFDNLGIRQEDVVAALIADSLPEKLPKFFGMREKLKDLGLPTDCVLDLESLDLGLLDRWRPLSELVQHYSDIFDYIIRDTHNSPPNILNRDKVNKWVEQAQGVFGLDPFGNLTISNLEPIAKVLKALMNKEKQSALSIRTAWANQRLFYALKSCGITEREIICGTDCALLERIADEERTYFEDGIDRYFREAIRIKPTRNNSQSRGLSALTHELTQKIAEYCESLQDRSLAWDKDIIISSTPPFNKHFTFTLTGDAPKQLASQKHLEIELNKHQDPRYQGEPISSYLIREKGDPMTVHFSVVGTQQISIAVKKKASGELVDAVRAISLHLLQDPKFKHSYEEVSNP
ncbi:MAG: HD domain-containing protein [SAR324 cluster bacterium]|uniref:HD domain-containing protein n=1 Tax=SAR324 cluster bacterium TaxID=2024889 RepID=A0A7X9FT65_9DELT|nr:HD domain-containing protein [SAR324 cluster bacterium]